jgi:hypothetical protein
MTSLCGETIVRTLLVVGKSAREQRDRLVPLELFLATGEASTFNKPTRAWRSHASHTLTDAE